MTRFINPRPQYFDASGNILASGKATFYISGTSDLKDTYADVNETTLNTNPVILTADGRMPNVFYTGVARVVLTTSGDVPVPFDVDDVGISTSGDVFDVWSNTIKYNDTALVLGSDENYYRSLQNDNVSNDPTTSSTFWEQMQFTRVWNAAVTYASGDFVHASDGKIYRSKVGGNLNNDPTSSPDDWGGSSILDEQAIIEQTVTNLGAITGPTSINWAAGQNYIANMTAIATLTITGTVTTSARTLQVLITNGNTFAPTFAGGTILWEGGAAPTPTATDLYTFKQMGAGNIYASGKAHS